MKNIYLIGGTMGVGKTAICQRMKTELNNSVFLDGDWCWDMSPFIVTGETRRMVMDNICFLLNSYIKCSVYENIIFCWVMHEQAIIDEILSRLDTTCCHIHAVSLVINGQALREHLKKDIIAGIRTEDIIKKSLERIPLYEKLHTQKVDVSEIDPEKAAQYIIHNC